MPCVWSLYTILYIVYYRLRLKSVLNQNSSEKTVWIFTPFKVIKKGPTSGGPHNQRLALRYFFVYALFIFYGKKATQIHQPLNYTSLPLFSSTYVFSSFATVSTSFSKILVVKSFGKSVVKKKKKKALNDQNTPESDLTKTRYLSWERKETLVKLDRYVRSHVSRVSRGTRPRRRRAVLTLAATRGFLFVLSCQRGRSLRKFMVKTNQTWVKLELMRCFVRFKRYFKEDDSVLFSLTENNKNEKLLVEIRSRGVFSLALGR